MRSKYVVDTHAMIWFIAGDSRLGPNAKQILSNPNSELILSHHSPRRGVLDYRTR